MPLSAVAVRNAKPREKPYKLSDDRGLFLLVTPKGQRYWRYKYRYDGKEKILAFGVYPDVSLADAREKRDAARKVVAAGEDPAANKKRAEAEKRARSLETFSIVADEWLERLEKEGRSASTLSKLRWLTDFARPALGDRPIAEITAPELLEVLRKVEARGRYETANRLRSTFGTIFRYAIATGRAQRDVAYDLRGALITPKVSHRSAITDPKEIGALLRAIEGHEGQPAVRHGLRLLPHVFVRPGELRLAQWQEFDLETRRWTIPADRTKMRRQHRVPLSSQALGILRELEAITGDGKLLFPSILSAERAISDNTMNAALRRLGYDKSQMTAHGFRAMASTLLNETGKWHPDAIERQLAHVEGNDVRRAYARGEHWEERVRMMQFWSDYLDQLRLDTKFVKGRFRCAA
jgi:integrase